MQPAPSFATPPIHYHRYYRAIDRGVAIVSETTGAEHLRDHLQALYGCDTSAWEAEGDILTETTREILEVIRTVGLDYVSAAGRGATAVVLRVRDGRLNENRALKVPRPVWVGGATVLEAAVAAERDTLVRVRHPNVTRLYHCGELTADNHQVAYVVTDYVETDALAYFRSHAALPRMVEFVHQVLRGLAYLHAEGILHLDLKPSNILLDDSSVPMIADLASSKVIGTGGQTTVVVSPSYAHPELRRQVNEQLSAGAGVVRLEHNELHERYDLYAMGKTFVQLLTMMPPACSADERYQMRYCKLIASRLLDGQESDAERVDGLTNGDMQEVRYRSAQEAVEDADRMIAGTDVRPSIPELSSSIRYHVQLGTGPRVPYTERVQKLSETQAFLRLRDCRQLGLLFYVYPSAHHTRWEHSLGTFALAVAFVKALDNDRTDPVFRSIMSDDHIRAVLLASLLHDIGHYPLAHDLEEVGDRFSHKACGISLLLRPDDGLSDGPVAQRSELNDLREDLLMAMGRDEPDGWGATSMHLVAAILTGRSQDDTFRMSILHSLIDGPIDVDRLSFMISDSRHCGVPYGLAIDWERLLSCLTAVYCRDGTTRVRTVGVTEKGLVSAEVLAAIRYTMYRAVYWHKTYRAIKSMLAWALRQVLQITREPERLVDDFLVAVLTGGDPEAQPTLFEEPMPIPEYLDGEGRVLRILLQLARRNNAAGAQEMLVLVANRRLYKREASISKARHPELHDELARLHTVGPAQLRTQADLQQGAEQHWLGGCSDEVRTAAESVAARGLPALLLDMPVRQTSIGDNLYFANTEQEERSGERSEMWGRLSEVAQDAWLPRVFVHPDLRGLLTSADRESLIRAVEEAARRQKQRVRL